MGSSGGPRPDTSGGYALPLVDRQVTQVRLDYRVGLLFDDGALVSVGGSLQLVADGGVEAMVEPERLETLAPTVELLRRVVEAAEAGKDGALNMTFDTGIRLHVPADARYEPWEAVGPGAGVAAWRIVSIPGGELVVWL